MPSTAITEPEGVSSQIAAAKFNWFYDVLESTVFTKDRAHIIPPENMFNVDESGYTVVQKPHKFLAKIEKRYVTDYQQRKGKPFVVCLQPDSLFHLYSFSPERT